MKKKVDTFYYVRISNVKYFKHEARRGDNKYHGFLLGSCLTEDSRAH